MAEKVLAWHFLRDDKRMQFRDGRRVEDGEIVEVGKTYKAEGDLKLCANGMHASLRAIDALEYAPGGVICRVELSGEIVDGGDKVCATSRKVLWMADATHTLHEFACWCAEQALLQEREAGREPDARSWAAVKAKRQWLQGEISDEELAAARDAATAAAWDAATDAALPSATDAAWDAAWAAARTAARDAAWTAATAAARDAATAAAWDAALTDARDAAWTAARAAAAAAARDAALTDARDAAWAAAWTAARDVQNTELERMLNELAP